MIKIPVQVYSDVERIKGVNDRGAYDFQKQAAQINIPNMRPLPFDIFVDEDKGVLPAGDYIGLLAPKLGRFNGNLDWEFKDFRAVAK